MLTDNVKQVVYGYIILLQNLEGMGYIWNEPIT